jgi:hypothetical protein
LWDTDPRGCSRWLPLVRQAKLGASCRVKVPVGRETRTVTRKG